MSMTLSADTSRLRGASGPKGSIPRPGLLYLLPTSCCSTAAAMAGSHGPQASIGKGGWIQCDGPSSNTDFTPAFTLCKDTQHNVLNPLNKIKSLGQQSIRMRMPLSQVPFHLSFCSRIQLSFQTQIPKLLLMLWCKIWFDRRAQFFLAGMLDTW